MPRNEAQTLPLMVPPWQRRPNAWRGGIIQIHVTRACDKACFGCTQNSQLVGTTEFMTPEDFRTAVQSLAGYWGVIGVFGGNPALSRHFRDYCRILQELVPFEQRGLWCNKAFGHAGWMRETFNPAVSNINVHQDREAWDVFRREWPELQPGKNLFGLLDDSRHSPVHGSMIDLGVPEAERWDRISRCDINQYWSSMIGLFRGELRAWFCEVAGAQAIYFQQLPDYPDTGLPVEPGWWERPMEDFAGQVRQHCHNCLQPLKGYGEMANAMNGVERTTESYAELFRPKDRHRQVAIVTELQDLRPGALSSTVDYLGNASK